MPFDIPAVARALASMASDMRDARRDRAEVVERLGAFYRPGFDLASWDARYSERAITPDAAHSGMAGFVPGIPANAQYLAEAEPATYALIASDGSQILPDRHRPVLFGLVQAACVSIVYGPSGGAADALESARGAAERRWTRFYAEAELLDESAGSPAGRMLQERDMLEIEALAGVAEAYSAAGVRPIALADGSIVPFSLLSARQPKEDAIRQAARIGRSLDRIKACGGLIVGYVDRPGSDALIGAIAAGLPDGPLSLRGLLDRHVLERALGPGARSASFDPGWRTAGVARLNEAGHAMQACYMNVGGSLPYICRLEWPAWAAQHAGALCAIVAHQEAAAVGDPYPFILRAAHENAVLTHADQAEIEAMLQRDVHDVGILAAPSAKQSAKESA